MKWLAAPNPTTNYQKALGLRHKGTGLWLLHGKPFTTWKNQRSSFLWLQGKIRTGKIILSSMVVEDLIGNLPSHRDLGVLFFYFNFSDARKQSLEDMLRSLINQLFFRHTNTRAHVQKLHRDLFSQSESPGVKDLQRTFKNMIGSLSVVCIILDTLDECQTRRELLAWVKHIHAEQKNVQLLVTSRIEQDIESDIMAWATSDKIIAINNNDTKGNISTYIQERLQQSEFKRWESHPDIQQEIRSKLL